MSLSFVSFCLLSCFSFVCSSGYSDEYDYIIVGAGTAGSMVAGRLAVLNPDSTILLIEEGYYGRINPTIDSACASCWVSLGEDDIVERGYSTLPESNMGNRNIRERRGRVTGGTNSINVQVWTLANENDFEQRWGNIDGWTLDDIIPIWEEIRSVNPGFRGSEDTPFMQRLLNAGISLGYDYNSDYNDLSNGGTQTGVSRTWRQSRKLNSTYYQRRTTWTDYVENILPRNNLDIMVLTRVNKVLLSGSSEYDNVKAIGVETYDIGTFEMRNIYARKEVIMSAGVFDTPKILQLSGIGDCDKLASILGGEDKCYVNIPAVGVGVKDHVRATLIAPLSRDSDDILNNEIVETEDFYAETLTSVNVWTESGEYELISWLNEQLTVLIVFGIYTHVESSGYVLIADNNPNSKPNIVINYLESDNDKEGIVNAVKLARKFVYDSGEFDDMIVGEQAEVLPGYAFQSDEQLLAALQGFAADFINHPVGSCRMTNDIENDDSAVVDSRLRVKGIENLRIVDSSIMPNTVSTHPNQMTMVIGYKGAQMITEDNSESSNDDSSDE